MRGTVAAALAALCLFAGASAAAADPPRCTLQKYGDLPVSMTDFRPVVPATINGQPVRLFIDTGAFWGTLGPATAQRLGLHVRFGDDAIAVRGVTGESRVGVTRTDSFALSDVYKTTGVDFLVAEHDLGGADGVLGQNLMGAVDVEYDLANGVVRLYRPKGCEHADLGYWAPNGSEDMAIDPIQLPSNGIHGTAVLNGVKIRVEFDTGTPRSLLTLRAARRAGIDLSGPDVVSEGDSAGVGRRLVQTWIAQFRSFDIGPEHITGARLRVADVDLDDVDMLIGADFFLSHRIYVARSENRLFFTYNGGPVFDLERHGARPAPTGAAPSGPTTATGAPPVAAPTATAASATPAGGFAAPAPAPPPAPATAAPASRIAEADDTPRDAAGFVRRAEALATREDFAGAIADYTSAIALQPNNAQLYADRGLAYVRNRQPLLAMNDFDHTIQLHPQAPRALVGRGELRLASHDVSGAEADFTAALRLTPEVAPVVGRAYEHARLYEQAVAVYDGVLAGKPIDEDSAAALFARCRARAFWGQQLDQALADCNQAMKLRPGGSEVVEVRALVYLRQGKFALALADDNAVLKHDPHDAWALYGRGEAEQALGDKAKGDADVAAALAMDPELNAELKAIGLGGG